MAAALRAECVDTADLDARVLVCAACEVDHAALIRDPDLAIGQAWSRLTDFAARRLAREPVARILGRREFWGLSLAIDPAVLDPRSETEGLVGSVLDALGGRRLADLAVLDLGTGSAAILCALLSELPNARGVGVDRSAVACSTAARNVSTLGLADRARIVCGSWTDSLRGRFDVAVSNPPYVSRAMIRDLPADVRDYDPIESLDGGADGLDAYREIIPKLGGVLMPGGLAAFECGYDQGDAVTRLMRRADLRDVRTYKDLAGHDRVAIGQST